MVAASGFNVVTEYVLIFVALDRLGSKQRVPSCDHWLRGWLRRRARRAVSRCGRLSPAQYVRQRCASHDFDKEHVKCVVHRIPNDDRIVDSSRAAIVLTQDRLSFRRDCEQYCPTRTGHLHAVD
jgi:hypothetical protein